MKTNNCIRIVLFITFLLALLACGKTEKNVIRLKNCEIHIIPYTNRSARILIYTPGEKLPSAENLTITKIPGKIEIQRDETGNEVVISWGSLKFKVDKNTGSISYFKKDRLLFNDVKSGSFSFLENPLGNTTLFRIEKKFEISPKEGLFGLGQFQDSKMNFQNHETVIAQANKIAVNPLLVSTGGYGILWDNYSKTFYKNVNGLTSFISEYAPSISYFVIAGDNMDDVVKGYRELTGDAPMFGKWAYGYWQSKERYKSFEELKDIVREYRARKIPIDNIVQDWKYWGENPRWSALQFDPATYPDPEKNIKDIHDLHAHLMVSIWPALGSETDVYKEMNSRGYLYGHFWSGPGAKLYDAYTKDARDIYWKYIKNNLIAKGVDALWMDGSEPELTSTETQDTTEREIIKCISPTVGPLARYLNPYSLVTTQGVYEGFRTLGDDKRLFILTRSVFTGQQRYAAATWSGDIAARWDVYKAQIAGGINFSVAGVPYWTFDIGAFFVGRGGGDYPDGCYDPCYRELYTRWFQFGAFAPIFRSHGTETPREVWRFGTEGTIFYEAMKKISILRYRLMPYIYSTAWRVTNSGYSFMRAMPMDFPGDTTAFPINDQYLFGESFLVKPVTIPMYFDHNPEKKTIELKKEKSVEVYLPGKMLWYDFWNGNRYDGGQKINATAPIDRLPLFVKAGSIVPLGPEIQYADQVLPENIRLLVFPGANGNFTLYEDDGLTYNYEKGEYSTIGFKWNDNSGKLTIQKRNGQYPGMLAKRKFTISVVHENMGEPANITGGKEVEYSGDEIVVDL